jgi:hypothetical protein
LLRIWIMCQCGATHLPADLFQWYPPLYYIEWVSDCCLMPNKKKFPAISWWE